MQTASKTYVIIRFSLLLVDKNIHITAQEITATKGDNGRDDNVFSADFGSVHTAQKQH